VDVLIKYFDVLYESVSRSILVSNIFCVSWSQGGSEDGGQDSS